MAMVGALRDPMGRGAATRRRDPYRRLLRPHETGRARRRDSGSSSLSNPPPSIHSRADR